MPGVVTIEVTNVGDGIEVTEEQVVELIYEESIWGAAKFLLHVENIDQELWQPVLTDPERRFQIRFKSDTTEDPSASPRKTVRYDFARQRQMRDGTEVLIDGMDAGWDIFQAYKGSVVYRNIPITSMVAQIAERSSIPTDIVASRGSYNVWQCNYPDAWFIKYVLLPRTFGDTRSDYEFFIRNGTTLVFRPPDLSKEKVRFVIPPGEEREENTNVEYYEFHMRDSILTAARSLSNVMRGFDRLRKTYVGYVANDNSVRRPKLSSHSPVPPVEPTRAIITAAPFAPNYDPRDVQGVGDAVWCRAHRSRYEVRVSVRGFMDIAPGDMFKIDSPTMHGGRYLCSRTRQSMNPQSRDLWTSIYGVRREHA